MKTRSSQTILWLVQRATAVVLCAALLFHFHFTIGRFAASGGLNYQELLNTLHQPLIKIVEIITFACALSHGSIGLWMITKRFCTRALWRKILSIFIAALGGSAAVAATVLIIYL